MTLSLPADIEKHVNDLVVQGAYPSVEAVLVDAVRALVREQERRQIESLLEQDGLDERGIGQLLQEAENSGDYTEMTAEDWKDIEREGMAIINSRKAC